MNSKTQSYCYLIALKEDQNMYIFNWQGSQLRKTKKFAIKIYWF
jgi:hypothetical protein